MSDEKRVILIKPGDVLLIAKTGPIDQDSVNAVSTVFREIGIDVRMWSEDDITIDAERAKAEPDPAWGKPERASDAKAGRALGRGSDKPAHDAPPGRVESDMRPHQGS